MLNKIKNMMSKKDKNASEESIDNTSNIEATESDVPSNEEGIDADNAGDQDDQVTPLEAKEKEFGELKDKYMRLLAEFENYKKRTIKEKIDLMGSAAKDTLSAILPVLDDFDRAKKSTEDEKNDETFSEGVSLVYSKIYNILGQKGLVAMESTGADFDPDFHEAITEIPAPSEDMKGKVIDTVEKGYMLKDKIIRHAKVVVGK